jgi:hypothetical protein
MRREPGCLWFDWSRSLTDPTEYVLVDAFRDDEAGAAHVRSAHFRAAQQTLPPHLAETPRIVNANVPQDDWSLLGGMAVHEQGQDGLRARSAQVTGGGSAGSAEQVRAAGRFAPLLSIDAVPLDGRAPVDLVPHALDLADGPVLLA